MKLDCGWLQTSPTPLIKKRLKEKKLLTVFAENFNRIYTHDFMFFKKQSFKMQRLNLTLT